MTSHERKSTVAQDLARLHALLPQAMLPDARWAIQRLDQARHRYERGQQVDRVVAEVATRLQASIAVVARRAATSLTIAYPEQLPVAQRRDDILAALRDHRVVVLTGETGSGKTTQLPKLLWEAGYGRRGMIAMTQPRRVAAIAMAARIREEMVTAAEVVAHSVRFDDRAAADTVIRVMTDGLLLAEAVSDPEFLRYDAIIIDEAHERSLNIDLLMGMIQLVRHRRPDLAVVVSSASIAAERFAEYFSGVSSVGLADAAVFPPVPIIAVTGRMFPVEIRHQPPGDDDIGYLAAALSAIRSIHDANETGDVLCFLPTERDILEARRRLQDIPGLIPVPLFGRLTPQEQQRVFASLRGRKVVLATNIAETSLTIPGIRYVIDTGLARVKRYQASSRTERLPVEAVSQASCLQRAGRAGRVEAGVCIRLYGADDFTVRDQFTSPEILRSNLAGVLLSCLSLGLGDPESFPWLDAPSSHAWHQARLLLDELGAFEQAPARRTISADDSEQKESALPEMRASGRLSPLGRHLAAIPADPQVARILLAGVSEGVPHEACTIAAFLSVQDPRVRPVGQEAKADAGHRHFVHEAGDLAAVLKLWAAYQAVSSNSARSRFCEAHFLGFRRMREWADVRHQLWQAIRDGRRGHSSLPAHGYSIDAWPLDRIHRSVLAGMLGNVLLYDSEQRCYRAAGDRRLHVHPGSALKAGKVDDGKRAPAPPPWLVACEVVETSRLFARLCAPINPLWVIELAGERVKRRYRDPHWHPGRKQVVCRETISWKGLPLSEGRLIPYERIDSAHATRLFIEQAMVAISDDQARFEHDFPIIAANRRTTAIARGLRDRLRDPSIDIDDTQIVEWYAERFVIAGDNPPIIASTDALRRFIATHGVERLRLRLTDVSQHQQAAQADRLAPIIVIMGGARLTLRYRFIPGDESDGVTLTVAESQLGLVEAERLEWLVPAWWDETITAYVQQLPKEQRRQLIPLAETVTALRERIESTKTMGSFAALLTGLVSERIKQSVAPFDVSALPPYLRLRFAIVGEDNQIIYAGRDPRFISAQLAAAGDRLRAVRSVWETQPSTTWPGDCPLQVSEHGIRGYLALLRDRDPQGRVAVRRAVFGSAEGASAWHDDGIDAALEAANDEALTALAMAPTSTTHAARVERILNIRLGTLRRHLGLSVLINVSRTTVRDAASFAALNQAAQVALVQASPMIDALGNELSQKIEALRNRLKQGAKSLAMATVMRGVGQHLELLLAPGWSQRLSWSALQRLPTYVDGLGRRLDGATSRPQDAQRSSDRIASILSMWHDAMSGDARLLQACGLLRLARELITVREETTLGIITGGGQGAGFSEGRLREGIQTIHQRLTAELSLIQRMRERALDVRASLQRMPPSARRTVLMSEGDQLLAAYPDLSFATDLAASRAGLEAWCERAVMALRV